MVEGWLGGLDEKQRAGLSLVWLAIAFDWVITAVLWGLAAWWLCRAWLITAFVAAAIPLSMSVGLLAIEPTFFGAWMLAGSVGLFTIGGVTALRRTHEHHEPDA